MCWVQMTSIFPMMNQCKRTQFHQVCPPWYNCIFLGILISAREETIVIYFDFFCAIFSSVFFLYFWTDFWVASLNGEYKAAGWPRQRIGAGVWQAARQQRATESVACGDNGAASAPFCIITDNKSELWNHKWYVSNQKAVFRVSVLGCCLL